MDICNSYMYIYVVFKQHYDVCSSFKSYWLRWWVTLDLNASILKLSPAHVFRFSLPQGICSLKSGQPKLSAFSRSVQHGPFAAAASVTALACWWWAFNESIGTAPRLYLSLNRIVELSELVGTLRNVRVCYSLDSKRGTNEAFSSLCLQQRCHGSLGLDLLRLRDGQSCISMPTPHTVLIWWFLNPFELH